MNKPVLNFVINSIMTLSMAVIIGIGLLIEFTFVSTQKLNLQKKGMEDMAHLFFNQYIQKIISNFYI
ncbi:MAG: hypothetical protein ACI9OE_001672 [Mariniflexile sp.]|jgi:hypothetical protein